MSIFDLVFILAFLATLAALTAAAVSALRGRHGAALRILRAYGICLAGYLAVSLAAAYLGPQRVLAVGEPWCFDDWCLTVDGVERTPGPSLVTYNVKLRIFSRARRVSQRAKGAWIYLMDDRGRRYPPEADPTTVPLDVLLQPLESVTTSRLFRVPAEARHLGLVTGHGGPYCGPMNVLIIGAGGCLFNKPAMIRIP